MLRASEAPFAPDIVRCSESWTTVDAGSVHRTVRERSLGRRRLVVPRAITRKKTSVAWTSSREITPQKTNRHTPRARFVGGWGFRRHLLSRCSVRAEIQDGEIQRAADMWSLRKRSEGWTDGRLQQLYMSTGREKANRGTHETETRRDDNWRNQLTYTIKERNSCNYVD
jgi:hypothetical protein